VSKTISFKFLSLPLSFCSIKGVQYVVATVVSTKRLNHIFYTLYNRQQIIDTNEIRVRNKKFASFRFEQPGTPVSKLLIWYTTKYGEIVSDVVDIEGAPGMAVSWRET
jgi:hypothetical protein